MRITVDVLKADLNKGRRTGESPIALAVKRIVKPEFSVDAQGTSISVSGLGFEAPKKVIKAVEKGEPFSFTVSVPVETLERGLRKSVLKNLGIGLTNR